ncbi:MAG: hypothetical protein AB7N65_03460 [Vicinamibacterales bacterium]
MRGRIGAGLVTLVLALPSNAQAQPQAMTDVLRKAGEYVESFQQALSGIVAEEIYLQEVEPHAQLLRRNRRAPAQVEQRRLRSDLLLVRPGPGGGWIQYRDVFEVDGRPVRDREDRLTRLVLTPGAIDSRRARLIREASARYNIGDIPRTMNVPVLPLAVLAPDNQRRFRFSREGTRAAGASTDASAPELPQTARFRVDVEAWVVQFEEKDGPTLVRTKDGDSVFSRGRFWIEPDSGRVLISEMIVEDHRVRGELLVSYRSEPLLGFLVPVELRERYSETHYPATITGLATYGNFRRVDRDAASLPVR